MVVGQPVAADAPTCRDRRAGGEPLPAVTVKRAGAGETDRGNDRVARGCGRPRGASARAPAAPLTHQAGADPGADRQVAEAVAPDRRAPAPFPERRARRRRSRATTGSASASRSGGAQRPARPPRLRRRSERAPARRVRIELDRPERRRPERSRRPWRREEVDDRATVSRPARRCGNSLDRLEPSRPRSPARTRTSCRRSRRRRRARSRCRCSPGVARHSAAERLRGGDDQRHAGVDVERRRVERSGGRSSGRRC